MHNARNGQLVTVALRFGLECHQMSLAQEKTFISFFFIKWPRRAPAIRAIWRQSEFGPPPRRTVGRWFASRPTSPTCHKAQEGVNL